MGIATLDAIVLVLLVVLDVQAIAEILAMADAMDATKDALDAVVDVIVVVELDVVQTALADAGVLVQEDAAVGVLDVLAVPITAEVDALLHVLITVQEIATEDVIPLVQQLVIILVFLAAIQDVKEIVFHYVLVLVILFVGHHVLKIVSYHVHRRVI